MGNKTFKEQPQINDLMQCFYNAFNHTYSTKNVTDVLNTTKFISNNRSSIKFSTDWRFKGIITGTCSSLVKVIYTTLSTELKSEIDKYFLNSSVFGGHSTDYYNSMMMKIENLSPFHLTLLYCQADVSESWINALEELAKIYEPKLNEKVFDTNLLRLLLIRIYQSNTNKLHLAKRYYNFCASLIKDIAFSTITLNGDDIVSYLIKTGNVYLLESILATIPQQNTPMPTQTQLVTSKHMTLLEDVCVLETKKNHWRAKHAQENKLHFLEIFKTHALYIFNTEDAQKYLSQSLGESDWESFKFYWEVIPNYYDSKMLHTILSKEKVPTEIVTMIHKRACSKDKDCVNIPDSKGKTPMHLACIQGNLEQIKSILNNHGHKNGDLYKKDNTGRHGLDYLIKNNQCDVADKVCAYARKHINITTTQS